VPLGSPISHSLRCIHKNNYTSPIEREVFKVERAGLMQVSARISELKGLQDDFSLPTENFIHVANSIQKTFLEIHTTPLTRER
jgi:hypothetical protein